ncbi:hypothetical protein [Acrocarpospora pleiomorpha]|nr:hypothetical protein [Acrocarpospora pleiomorpha]
MNSDQSPVVLTPHPLQRVGAYALAALAGVDSPEEMTAESFERAYNLMTKHLLLTARVEGSKDPGGFWLGASYTYWPNASGLNTTNRKKISPDERREQMRAWRTFPETGPDAPCMLCGRASCGFYGKVDLPLGASTSYRNTTVPGHDGLALCRGCLASFHALPYGCSLKGGKAVTLHSWDDEFLARAVPTQVQRTKEAAALTTAGIKSGPYAREVEALRWLRGYGARITEMVELFVFSNSNKEQTLDIHGLDQPLAEWLRTTMQDTRNPDGFRYLIRAHQTEKIPGTALLARNAFRNPPAVAQRVVSYLVGLAVEKDALPIEARPLTELCLSYVTEVLHVNQRDVDRVKELAARVAGVLAAKPERGTLKSYEHMHRESRRLEGWLKEQAVRWTLQPDQEGSFVTDEQWRLLFDSDGRSRLHRDILLISVLQELSQLNWLKGVPEDPDERADRDDDGLSI